MSLNTTRDIPMRIRSENASAERRITPSWSIAQLKTKLEPVTGIPPSSQRLVLRVPGLLDIEIGALDEETTRLTNWNLIALAEIEVTDTRPPAQRQLQNLNDVSSVPKYTMDPDIYSTLPNSVLAWKKNNNLGRFDPSAPAIERQKLEALWANVSKRRVEVGKRCRLGDARRGNVRYVGEVDEIPGLKGPWVGVELDEPVGRNDGSVGGKRYFDCGEKRGVFVRPERVEIGDFAVLNIGEEDDEDDMEEI